MFGQLKQIETSLIVTPKNQLGVQHSDPLKNSPENLKLKCLVC